MKSAKPSPFFKSLSIIATLLSASVVFTACGGSKESHSSTPKVTETPAAPKTEKASASAPTMDNMKTALVDAMQTISTNTVTEITKMAKGGEAVKLPESFESVKSVLDSAGKSDLISGFTSSLNDTAAGALSGYKDTLSKTISSINLPDIEKLIKGGDESITRQLETTAKSQIEESLIPYVKSALKDTAAEEWIEKIKDAIPADTGGLLGKVQAATGISLPTNFNVESYVTDELMGKFFDVMGNQEKLFRQNPKGRSAELFKKIMAAAQ